MENNNQNSKKPLIARMLDTCLSHGVPQGILGEDRRRLKIWNSILLIGILPNPIAAFLLFQSNATISALLAFIHIGVLFSAYLQTRFSQTLEMQFCLLWSSTWVFAQSVLISADLGIEFVLCSIGFLPIAVIPMEGRKLQAFLSLYPLSLACIVFLLPTREYGLYEVSSLSAYLIKCLCFMTFVFLSSAMVWIFVTETYNIQKSFQDSQHQLAKSKRLNDITKLAAGFAHEINNPAAIVSGSNEIIKKIVAKENSASKDKILQRLEVSDRAVLRITDIVKSIRQMSIGGPKDNLNSCLWQEIKSDLENLIQSKIEENHISLEIENPPSSARIAIEHSELLHVMHHLTKNAIDAVIEGKEQKRWIKIGFKLDKLTSQITIQDSGDGISQQVEDNILQPFFTTKELGSGMGLGLSVSFGIIKKAGGDLSIDKNNPHTTFKIKLMLANNDQKPLPAAS